MKKLLLAFIVCVLSLVPVSYAQKMKVSFADIAVLITEGEVLFAGRSQDAMNTVIISHPYHGLISCWMVYGGSYSCTRAGDPE